MAVASHLAERNAIALGETLWSNHVRANFALQGKESPHHVEAEYPDPA
jgi:hypothetical protein